MIKILFLTEKKKRGTNKTMWQAKIRFSKCRGFEREVRSGFWIEERETAKKKNSYTTFD